MASTELSNVAKIQRDQIDQLITKAKERLEKQVVMSAKIERFLTLMYVKVYFVTLITWFTQVVVCSTLEMFF
jgi:regulator of sirC expression with transglutaminase-like and TPR domain